MVQDPLDAALREDLLALGGICKGLMHSKRLVLLYALHSRPHTVRELCEVVQAPYANTSQHLGVLRSHGLVEAHRHGSRVVYSLRHPKVVEAIDIVRHVVCDEIDRKHAMSEGHPRPEVP